MDIFVRGIPDATADRELKRFFKEKLMNIGIPVFHCEKFKGKGQAILTLADTDAATKFLSSYGSFNNNVLKTNAPPLLMFKGRRLICTQSNRPANRFMISSLRDEQNELKKRQARNPERSKDGKQTKSNRQRIHTFSIESLKCGLWEFEDAAPVFHNCYEDPRSGTLRIGGGKLLILLRASGKNYQSIQIEIPYSIIDSTIIGDQRHPCLTISLQQSPVMIGLGLQNNPQEPAQFLSQLENTAPEASELFKLMASLKVQTESRFNCQRLASLHHPDHTFIAGFCLVYQVTISDPTLLSEIPRTMSAMSAAPRVHAMPMTSKDGRKHLLESIIALKNLINSRQGSTGLAYLISFQIQACFQNGLLHPNRLMRLLPKVVRLASRYTIHAVVEGLQSLWVSIPRAGPAADPSDFDIDNLEKILEKRVLAYRIDTSSLERGSQSHEHLGIIHRVRITPSGMYLEGPFLEVKNRVIRKYPDHTDYFIRVEFSDEDGGRLLRRPTLDNSIIYRKRFLGILNSSIDIAGRSAKFLGFSNSSLRTASCWFMAPFIIHQQLLSAEKVISDLGDFSHIKSPARTAARIGQAFSDATDAVPIPKSCERKIDDIERNNRCFTDGVGQISRQLLDEVWATLRRSRKHPVTCLQIRYRGAKGMVALNSRLPGKQICLRPSMIKFEGSEDRNLEIIGASHRPLPAFLNKQFIKILEDLGVEAESFINLQEKALAELSRLASEPTETSKFLEKNNIGVAAQMPSLIKELDRIGIHFQEDPFLRKVVALSALVQLRDLKYRARIPVPNAAHLYGIVDETGYLEENQVYVVTTNQRGSKKVLQGPALITRAPTNHPGDVKIVRAIDVPEDSPLQEFRNCVVFSQHGPRDLPSQLSGGDLDGDLFSVIFDKSLWPTKVYKAADYPRLSPMNINRPVQVSDITDFFVTFMESDQLGYICNTQLIVADQEKEGTFNEKYLTLAELASTAVDFAKTGIAPNMSMFPKRINQKVRPDFMANAPNVLVDESESFEQVEDIPDEEDEENEAEILNPDANRYRYYRSKKVLGRLFRNIDEQKIFHDLRADLHKEDKGVGVRVLDRVWNYVEKETKLIQWRHHWDFALSVKDAYEEALKSAMYNFSPHRRGSLTEGEAFAGVILARKGGMPNKQISERARELKDEIGRNFAYIREWIVYGDAGRPESQSIEDEYENEGRMGDILGVSASAGDGEALERSIACLAVGIQVVGGLVDHTWPLKSFPYIAAGVCLKELARFKGHYGI